MSTNSMRVTFNALAANSCQEYRKWQEFGIELKDTDSSRYQESKMKKGLVRDWVGKLNRLKACKEKAETEEEKAKADAEMKKLEEEMLSTLEEGMDDISYPSPKEKEVHLKESKRELSRYVNSTANKFHNTEALTPERREVKLSEELTVTDVYPDIEDVEAAPIDPVTGEKIGEYTLTVAMLKMGKCPSGLNNASAVENLQVQALRKYAESRVLAGHKVYIRAGFMYMKKNSDKSVRGGKAEHFDDDYYITANGNHIVFIEELYEAPAASHDGKPEEAVKKSDQIQNVTSSKIDSVCENISHEYVEGKAKKACTKHDCEYCTIREECKYQNASLKKAEEFSASAKSKVRYTDSQRKYIATRNGYVRVLAGPGAGKTKSLIAWAVDLLMDGVQPEEIMLVSFSNTAVNELKARIGTEYQKVTRQDPTEIVEKIRICTFHKFGEEVIIEYWPTLGYTREPRTIEKTDSGKIAKALLDKADFIDGLNYSDMTRDMERSKGAISVMLQVFSIAKKYRYTAADYEELYKSSEFENFRGSITGPEVVKDLLRMYETYEEELKRRGLMVFEDMGASFVEIDRQKAKFLEKYGIKYLAVDEAQDTSPEQEEFIKLMIQTRQLKCLMAVGDAEQSIFSFAGALGEFLRKMDERLKVPVATIELAENFRSTANIVDFAKTFISYNQEKSSLEMKAMRPAGMAVEAEGYFSKEAEYDAIVKKIQDCLAAGHPMENILVLMLRRTQLMEVATRLTGLGIPSVMVSSQYLLENSRVQAQMAFMRLLQHPDSTKDLYIFSNCYLRGGIMELEKEEQLAEMQDNRDMINELCSLSESKRIEEIKNISYDLDEETGDEVYEEYLDRLFKRKSLKDMFSYVNDLPIYGKQETFRSSGNYPGVQLCTIHSSKGMESPVVILSITDIGKNSSNLGGYMAADERRRLIYVGATRAKDELYISGQYMFGKAVSPELADVFKALGKSLDANTVKAEAEKFDAEKRLKDKAEREARRAKDSTAESLKRQQNREARRAKVAASKAAKAETAANTKVTT